MKTSEGITEGLKTSQVAFSLTMLTILLTLVTAIAVVFTINHCRKGPAAIEE
jgi:cytochrome bd-type quinol oxidase subunit 1